MPVLVRIPPPLQRLTKGEKEVNLKSGSVQDIITQLETSFPGLKDRLCDEQGELRRFVNIYVNENDIRFQNGLATKVEDGAEVSIIPAVAGGLASREEGRGMSLKGRFILMDIGLSLKHGERWFLKTF